LSTELEKHLHGSGGTLTVLVQGPQSEVDRLAKTYGLTVTRRLKSGGDLTGPASKGNPLAGDTNVGSLREDGQGFGMMAVTTQSPGANQVCSSRGNPLGGIPGNGVNVAVIDSGISNHPALNNRLLGCVDLRSTAKPGDSKVSNKCVDDFGHGTHVAGTIAS